MSALASVRQRRVLVNAAKGVLTPIAASKKRASQAALTAQTAKTVLINLPENLTTNAQPRPVLGAMHLLGSALCAQPNPKAISAAAVLAAAVVSIGSVLNLSSLIVVPVATVNQPFG